MCPLSNRGAGCRRVIFPSRIFIPLNLCPIFRSTQLTGRIRTIRTTPLTQHLLLPRHHTRNDNEFLEDHHQINQQDASYHNRQEGHETAVSTNHRAQKHKAENNVRTKPKGRPAPTGIQPNVKNGPSAAPVNTSEATYHRSSGVSSPTGKATAEQGPPHHKDYKIDKYHPRNRH